MLAVISGISRSARENDVAECSQVTTSESFSESPNTTKGKDLEQFSTLLGSISSSKQPMTATKSTTTRGNDDVVLSSIIISRKLCKGQIISVGSSLEANNNGSSAVIKKKDANIMVDARSKHKISNTLHHQREGLEFLSKPRTALLQGREDDEPTTHQVVVSRLAQESGTVTNSFMKFGSFLVDVNASVIPYNNLFIGANVKLHPCSGVFGQ